MMLDHRRPDALTHALLVTGARTWVDKVAMKHAFHEIWTHWGPVNVTRPVLISGGNPRGADGMAERLFAREGFEIIQFPANWNEHGRAAGIIRNRLMVETATTMRDAGATVHAAAFLMRCTKPGCPQAHRQQLNTAGYPGHWSHGTSMCRNEAVQAGLPMLDVFA